MWRRGETPLPPAGSAISSDREGFPLRHSLAVLLVVSTVAACAAGPKLPPKAGPEEVEFIDPQLGQEPDEGYKTIGPVRVSAALGTSPQELTRLLRARAAQLGADAVILQRVRRTTEGEIEPTAAREEEMIVEGLAIYYPKPETQPPRE